MSAGYMHGALMGRFFEGKRRKVIVELRHFAASQRPERIGGAILGFVRGPESPERAQHSAQVVRPGYAIYAIFPACKVGT